MVRFAGQLQNRLAYLFLAHDLCDYLVFYFDQINCDSVKSQNKLRVRCHFFRFKSLLDLGDKMIPYPFRLPILAYQASKTTDLG